MSDTSERKLWTAAPPSFSQGTALLCAGWPKRLAFVWGPVASPARHHRRRPAKAWFACWNLDSSADECQQKQRNSIIPTVADKASGEQTPESPFFHIVYGIHSSSTPTLSSPPIGQSTPSSCQASLPCSAALHLTYIPHTSRTPRPIGRIHSNTASTSSGPQPGTRFHPDSSATASIRSTSGFLETW